MLLEALVHRIPMQHPGDVSGLTRLLDSGEVQTSEILAILGKAEGNDCVHDYSRGYAVLALPGATEGALSPHFMILSTRQVAAAAAGPALAIGVAHTREFQPEEIGRQAQVDAAAAERP